jgi:Flp pilus assembly protein CpaB
VTLNLIAAIVIATAGIAGMLFLYRWGAFNADAATTAQVDLYRARADLSVAKVETRATSELATQMAHEARALGNIVKSKDAEIERLARLQPHYGRDKNGRFKRIAA